MTTTDQPTTPPRRRRRPIEEQLQTSLRLAAAIGPSADGLREAALAAAEAVAEFRRAYSAVRTAGRAVGITDESWHQMLQGKRP
jgi:type II secretory pathway component PulM